MITLDETNISVNLQHNLQPRYVAFLDVLGFKELVYARRIGELEMYFDTISVTLDVLKNDKRHIKSLLISDSTILISPDSTDDFKTLLRAVQTIQAKLALKNIWIRGGISYGEVYFDQGSNIVVGKGLIDAYLLESQAKFPRVIIDTTIIKRIAENRQLFYHIINPDFDPAANSRLKLVHNFFKYIPDDCFFVAYGHRIILDAIRDKSMHIVYELILNNVYADQKNYEKHVWVKNYFMNVINDLWDRWPYLVSNNDQQDRVYINEWFRKFAEI
jgi:hypothetical protein